MAYYRTPMMVAEPYEEAGPESPTETSPDELQAFYEDMDRREILERKLSKRKSNSGTSIWSRKSLKRSTTAPPIHPNPNEFTRTESTANHSERSVRGTFVEIDSAGEQYERADLVPQLSSSRPNAIDRKESQASMDKDAWASVPLPTFKVKYHLHNPQGPRWYRNYHLIPPSHMKPSMRPPTFFSPSFPPISSSSTTDHMNHMDHMDDTAGLSRTPSHSPLPTPTSSQTRVGDAGGKPRSRKTSQTTPDNVDLLDLTDPWGTSWHHQSPYDVFGQTPAVAADNHGIPSRTRRASMTAAQSRHKSVTPSPLSQSTSAVHLQVPGPVIEMPRKLSKRRTPAVGSIFGPQSGDVDRKTTSAPATPIDRIQLSQYGDIAPPESTTLPKRMSVAPAPGYLQPQTSKKEKRGSMLNRLAKKFSILRKSTDNFAYGNERADDWQNGQGQNYMNGHDYAIDRGRVSPEKPHLDSVKRIPPPSFETPPEPEPKPQETPQNPERSSMASFDTPFSMGRLTIANPDLPDPEIHTMNEAPLPPEKPREIDHGNHRPVDDPPAIAVPPQLHPESTQSPSSFLSDTPTQPAQHDKPLPLPQLETPIVPLAVINVQSPELIEKSLPQPTSPIDSSPTRSPRTQLRVLEESPKRMSPLPPQKTPSANHTALTPVDTSPVQPNQSDSPGPQSQIADTPKRRSSQSQAPPPFHRNQSSASDKANIDRSRPLSPSVQSQHVPVQETRMSSQPQATIPSHNTPSTPESTVGNGYFPERNHKKVISSHEGERQRDDPTAAHHSGRTRSQSRSQSASVPPPVHVPFPVTQALEHDGRRYLHEPYEDSPLSTSSMLANPPTPCNRLSTPLSPEETPPSLPAKSIYEGKHSSQEPSTMNPSPSRQTETFRLIRSSSGNVYASSETILAAGQQWEVVESVEAKGRRSKSSSKSKELEQVGRRESKVEPKSKVDVDDGDYHQSRNHRSSKQPQYREEPSRSKPTTRTSSRRQEEHAQQDERSRQEERSKREERSRQEEYAQQERSRQEERARQEERSRQEERKKQEERARQEEYARQERLRQEERAQEERSRQEHHARQERSRQEERARQEERSRQEERARQEERSRQEERLLQEERARHQERSRQERARQEDRARQERIRQQEEHSARQERIRQEEQSSRQERPRHEDRSRQERSSRPEDRRGERSRHEEHKSSRKRDDLKERKKERRSTEPQPSSSHQYNTPQPFPTLAHPNPPVVRLQRIPSLTARPTSELPSAAEMNAMRAKESWEMERLWRARSMYGLEPNAPTTNFIHGPGSTSSQSDDTPPHEAMYGSSHTAFVVQSPFQIHGSQIYHSMPTGPPPIIYSSPASIPSIPDSLSSYDPYDPANIYRPYQTLANHKPAEPIPRVPLNNPLPEPPRESPYEPAPLTSARQGNKIPPDYSRRSNGVTTTR
ncbi:hypothetical protein B0H34DRAFT_792401 [Crassisporium funariophilum]|nr:hypothetical protein B0H34DRAFT_792401 [Crassisporium funariophilum]